MNLIPFHRTLLKMSVLFILMSLIIIGKSMQKLNQSSSLVLGFGGDTMLGRLANEVISLKGYAYPWGTLLTELKKTDLNIVNLENTFTTSKKKVPKVFNFKATPDTVETLKIANIDIVNLANNHSLDFDIEGLQETIQTLNNANILHTGAGMNINQARMAAIITKNNVKIGVVGYTDNEPDWAAGTDKPGINYIKVGDIEKIKKDIAEIRPQVDILIASIHWGPNMQQKPTQEFIDFAHQMVDAGIDIIHGHSAHIFHGIEIYNKKLIMYDTGDFVDDYRVDPVLRNDQSFFYIVTVDKSGIQNVQLIPTLIDNVQVNRATGETYREIIGRMQQLSRLFGTEISNDGKIIIS